MEYKKLQEAAKIGDLEFIKNNVDFLFEKRKIFNLLRIALDNGNCHVFYHLLELRFGERDAEALINLFSFQLDQNLILRLKKENNIKTKIYNFFKKMNKKRC